MYDYFPHIPCQKILWKLENFSLSNVQINICDSRTIFFCIKYFTSLLEDAAKILKQTFSVIKREYSSVFFLIITPFRKAIRQLLQLELHMYFLSSLHLHENRNLVNETRLYVSISLFKRKC